MKPLLVAAVSAAVLSAAVFTFGGPNRASAVEDTYVPLFFAGRGEAHDWCDGIDSAEMTVMSAAAAAWLDLDAGQRTKLGELVASIGQALKQAETLCPKVIEAQRGMDLPQQLAILRKQLQEADAIAAAVEAPLAAFHASLTPEQAAKIRDHEHGARDRGWWTPHGAIR